MIKRTIMLTLVLFITLPMFAISTSDMKIEASKLELRKSIIDENITSKTPYSGATGPYFDKSANGAGWYQGYNRKVAWNADPTTGSMVGSVYRKLNPSTGTGTVGGLIGEWTGTDLNYLNYLVMDVSPNWGTPGGRYPYTLGFINGYLFGMFADINYVGTNMEGGFPVFAVADASFGYDFASWDIVSVAATAGGARPDPVISCTGDVVYDSASGYYYVSQGWDNGEILDVCVKSFIVGRSMTPADASSWEWSDYNDFIVDASDDTYGMTDIGDVQFAYCKDRLGVGTGYGIAVAIANDTDDYVMVDSTQVLLNGKISYKYTTNWGGDDSTGDWAHNWIGDVDDKWLQIDSKDIFDWYGSTYTEIDSATNDTIVTILNDPYLTWNVSAVATEYNKVHLLLKVIGGTYEGDLAGYYLYTNDDDFITGYYSLRGEVTDSGVIWGKAKFVASMVGLDTGETDMATSNMNNLSIGYAGFGQLYATWLDRPISRATLVPDSWDDTAINTYMCDGFLSFSCDDGDTWEIPDGGHVEVEFPEEPGHIYNLYYAQNVTATPTLLEGGWSVSTTGKIEGKQIEVYAASQYFDAANTIEDPPLSSTSYQQFLHLWKITGSISDGTGIQAEQVAIDMDFELMQNYPNPFNPSTEISFMIQNDANVKLNVFNSNGETVVSLVDGKMAKGLHNVNFDATKLNSGVYFYQLDVNGMKSTKKMVLAK